ncbi:MAG TPA: aspartate kinase [Bacteroidetes bacterium]|nr:aspartate kinase [Bacteroidota bacterium]
MKVFKFGGASIKDAEGFRNVLSILKKFSGQEIVLVVSALGKTTNALEEVVHSYFERNGNANQLLNEVREKHFNLLSKLIPDSSHKVYEELNNTFIEVDWILEDEPSESFDYIYDQIVSIGEMVSTKMLAAFLNESGMKTKWRDVRDFIRTDNTYREGKVDWEITEKKIQAQLVPASKNGLVLTQGFIGGTSENFSTTLGREGSDYTAAVIAYCAGAESVTIWKDVPGVLNADPRYFSDAKKIDHLSFKETIEMTFYGATVIHPKTIKPLQNKNIPLHVKSFLNAEASGTVIDSDMNDDARTPVLVLKPEQILISVSPKDFSFMAEEQLAKIFGMMAKHRVKFNMMQNAAISFSFCADDAKERVNPFLEELSNEYKVLLNEGLELLTIRHYDEQTVQTQTQRREILLEQKTRNTIQLVVRRF